jgi:peroxiredoxin
MRNLKELGQRVVTNTVATRQNMKHLASLASLLVELRVDQYQIAFPHPTGHAATYFHGVVPRMRELWPHVRAALDVGAAAGVRAMVEAMPYCQLPGYERYAAELVIPPTELVFEGYVVPDYGRERMDRGKTRFPQCATCRFEAMCEGPWREYPEVVGADEFQPVAGPRVLDGMVVLDERFALLGTPAPDVIPYGPGWTAVVFYAEDFSPTCTTELCALRDAHVNDVNMVAVAPGDHAAFARAHGLTFPMLDDRDGAIAGAFRNGRRRSTYLVGPGRTIDHILVEPDVARAGEEIAAAIRRFGAPPRSIERGEELVVIRRRPARAEALAELGLDE